METCAITVLRSSNRSPNGVRRCSNRSPNGIPGLVRIPNRQQPSIANAETPTCKTKKPSLRELGFGVDFSVLFRAIGTSLIHYFFFALAAFLAGLAAALVAVFLVALPALFFTALAVDFAGFAAAFDAVAAGADFFFALPKMESQFEAYLLLVPTRVIVTKSPY